MPDELYVSPESLREAAQQLGALATGLMSALSRNIHALSPPPSGLDEVSVAASRWSNAAAAQISARTQDAAAELTAAAQAIAVIAARYATEDDAFSGALASYS